MCNKHHVFKFALPREEYTCETHAEFIILLTANQEYLWISMWWTDGRTGRLCGITNQQEKNKKIKIPQVSVLEEPLGKSDYILHHINFTPVKVLTNKEVKRLLIFFAHLLLFDTCMLKCLHTFTFQQFSLSGAQWNGQLTKFPDLLYQYVTDCN